MIDPEEPQPPQPAEPGLRRRRLLAGGVAAAGTAWVAPSAISVPASAALASPAPTTTTTEPPSTTSTTQPQNPPSFGGYQSESGSGIDQITVTMMNLNDPGCLVLTVGTRGALGFNTPDGWSLVGTGLDLTDVGVLAVFYKLVTSSTETVTVTLPSSASALTAAMVNYRNAVNGIEPASAQTFATGISTSITADSISTSGPDHMVVYAAGWESAAGAASTPGGFTNRGNVTNLDLSISIDDHLQAASGSVGATTATLPTSSGWAAGQIAVW